jgi:hypothetical protein
MSKKPDNGSQWKGDGVAKTAGNIAERAADRAEGRSDRRPEAEEAIEQQPVDAVARPASGESAEEKIAEAAEAHRARATTDARPARGKL